MTAAQTVATVVALATIAGLLLATIALQIVNDRPDMFLPELVDRPVIGWKQPEPTVLIRRPPITNHPNLTWSPA